MDRRFEREEGFLMFQVLVLGAGPCGLGAAHQLKSFEHCNWRIFERDLNVGGLSTSFVDCSGFTWDVGGHVLFSHFKLFDQVVDAALCGAYLEHMRECWVRIMDGWVPYPFQNNVRHLPKDARDQCVNGLKNLSGSAATTVNFKEWMDAVFGEGIVRHFMAPYNWKVWATPAELMSKDWIAERVSVVDLARIERNIAEQRDDTSWGPNNLFKFPLKGGTGAIFRGIANSFSDRIHLNHELAQLDLANRQVVFTNGVSCRYDQLISTIPLDELVAKCSAVPAEIRAAANNLVHNSVFVVGIGLQKKMTDSKCWMYFPEDNCPFYRVTNFHNYSPQNVPDGNVEKFSALMCETSYSPFKPVDKETIMEATISGLIRAGLLEEADRPRIVSQFLLDVPYAYPVPTVDRDAALAVIQPFLESYGVYSRGRFGAWKYEVGNMDHSFMQGVEVAERLITGAKEQVFHG